MRIVWIICVNFGRISMKRSARRMEDEERERKPIKEWWCMYWIKAFQINEIDVTKKFFSVFFSIFIMKTPIQMMDVH